MFLTKLSLAGHNVPNPSPWKVWSKIIQESCNIFLQCTDPNPNPNQFIKLFAEVFQVLFSLLSKKVVLTTFILRKVILINVVLTKVVLTRVVLTKVILTKAELTKVRLTKVKLTKVGFTKVALMKVALTMLYL